jgi:transglutaminase superfamily protein
VTRRRAGAARAALWALRCAARTGRQLHRLGLEGIDDIPAPPSLAPGAIRGARAALRLAGASCLVRAAVMRRWYEAQGRELDLVIGVTSPAGGFRAHAWLEGELEREEDGGFQEMLRLRSGPRR